MLRNLGFLIVAQPRTKADPFELEAKSSPLKRGGICSSAESRAKEPKLSSAAANLAGLRCYSKEQRIRSSGTDGENSLNLEI